MHYSWHLKPVYLFSVSLSLRTSLYEGYLSLSTTSSFGTWIAINIKLAHYLPWYICWHSAYNHHVHEQETFGSCLAHLGLACGVVISWVRPLYQLTLVHAWKLQINSIDLVVAGTTADDCKSRTGIRCSSDKMCMTLCLQKNCRFISGYCSRLRCICTRDRTVVWEEASDGEGEASLGGGVMPTNWLGGTGCIH
jgi:hypothetical protein